MSEVNAIYVLPSQGGGALPTGTKVAAHQRSDGGLIQDVYVSTGTVQLIDVHGHVANIQHVSGTISGDEYGVVTNAIIHGRSTAGGGAFVDVKVSPSGAVQVGGEVAITSIPTGSATSLNQTNGSQKTQIVTASGTNVENKISTNNTTTVLLASGSTYTGTWENVAQWTSAAVTILGSTLTSGVLWIDVRRAGSTIYNSVPFTKEDITSNPKNLPVVWNIIEDEFRVRYVNGSTPQTGEWYLQTKFSTAQADTLVGSAGGYVDENTPLSLHKTILAGETAGGQFKNVPVDSNGHIEVALHSPQNPFGSIWTESRTPLAQADGVYGVNTDKIMTTTGLSFGSGTTSGLVTGTNNEIQCHSGNTPYSFATAQTVERLRYIPGQGIVAEFTMRFSEPADGTLMGIGIGSSESGVYFAYSGTAFGMLHVTDGLREIQTMTITTGSVTTNNYLLTLPGGNVVTGTATNNASTVRTAYEISTMNIPGWSAQQIDSTVIFLADDANNKAGTFSITQSAGATRAAGSTVVTREGQSSTNTWHWQNDWNGDPLNGSGSSGVNLNKQRGNIGKIGMQYLGYGDIVGSISTSPDNNNSDFVDVHTVTVPNTRTSPTLSNPSMPITSFVYSLGGSTNVSVSSASMAGFLEGEKKLNGARRTYYRETNNYVGSATGTFYPLFTVRNDYVFKGKANQGIVNLISIGGGHDDATPVYFFLIKNATLGGTPNFTPFTANSPTSWDTSATTATITDNAQIVFSLPTGDAAGDTIAFGENPIRVQPGEYYTLAARAVTATAPYVLGTLNAREDI